ncbi:MAG: HD domain-containing protein [Thermoplasmata archaeon]|nr:HD domain-containing protein [Thermoplasmata archaeon]
MKLSIPVKGNKKLEEIIARAENDIELGALWKASNVMAIDRMGFNDHGPTHVKIVANIALKMLRIFIEKKRVPNAVKNYGMTKEDAEVIVVLGSLLHDIGHVVHRMDHENFAIPLAVPVIDRLLHNIYDASSLTLLQGEILHAIISHKSGIIPQTLEAGIVKVADALDMEQGRARIPFKSGSVNIHSVSAMAIEKVEIRTSADKVLEIEIRMSNSAGIYQIDDLLRERLSESRLDKDIKVLVQVSGEEKKIIESKIEI